VIVIEDEQSKKVDSYSVVERIQYHPNDLKILVENLNEPLKYKLIDYIQKKQNSNVLTSFITRSLIA
jgi:hypothetical protein